MADESVIYINGEFKPLSEASVPVLDQGFLLGDAVFDVVSAWKGNLFRLDAHLERFEDRFGRPDSRPRSIGPVGAMPSSKPRDATTSKTRTFVSSPRAASRWK